MGARVTVLRLPRDAAPRAEGIAVIGRVTRGQHRWHPVTRFTLPASIEKIAFQKHSQRMTHATNDSSAEKSRNKNRPRLGRFDAPAKVGHYRGRSDHKISSALDGNAVSLEVLGSPCFGPMDHDIHGHCLSAQIAND